MLEIIKSWYSDKKDFFHQTSGSTGKPKLIKISRNSIQLSAQATMSYLDPNELVKESLLCIDPVHIGGAMVIYRGLIYNHNITIVEPNSYPFKDLESDEFDIASMVPMQFEKLKEKQINRCGIILIGGAPMPIDVKSYSAKVYSTYGMTETVSHIALRKIDMEEFHTTGDTIVAVDNSNSLKIKGSITANKWLKTTDLATVTSEKTFRWLGRKDFVINSGGIKINPEFIEEKLSDQFENDFMISSLPDKTLGSKVVLISSGSKQVIDFDILDKYHRPKESFFDCNIFKTTSGKIDRAKTQAELKKSI
ncbi:AMP-binding protein [Ekhidna sp.]